MKRAVQSILLTLLVAGCEKDAVPTQGACGYTNYRYYNHTTLPLGEMSNDYLLVGFDTTMSSEAIRKFISGINYFDQKYRYTINSNNIVPLKFNRSMNCAEIASIISMLQRNTAVAFSHYTTKTDNCQNSIFQQMGQLCVDSYSSYFYVKVFDQNDLTSLKRTIAETNTMLVAQLQFQKDWFLLKATKDSKGDGMKMANYFYETKRFDFAEPDILKLPVE